MEKIYNKLVRDNVPDIIKSNNGKPFIKVLNEDEFKKELENKLYEEYKEVLDAKDPISRIEELADMLEIISTLAKLEGKSLVDVIEVAKEKNIKRGGFDNKIFLEKVIESD